MNRRLAIRTLMGASVGSFLNLLPAGQPNQPAGQPTPADQAADDFVLHSQVRLVLLDVSVKDKGHFVSGLSKQNFSVFENGRPQPIKVFANDDVPVTIGILVDESRSMTPKRSQVLAAAAIFIEESNP